MLLLLPLLDPIIAELDKSNKQIKLDDIFQINIGVMDEAGAEYYVDNAQIKENRVRILRMGSFDPIKKRLKTPAQLDEGDKNLKDIRKQRLKKITSFKKEIAASKLLSKNDYIINTRGVKEYPITGYSMLENLGESAEHGIGKVAASHHFIVLKPRTTALKMHIPFLHLMLDVLVENYLKEMAEGLKKGIFKSKDLKNMTFNVPLDFDAQVNTVNRYAELVTKRNMAIAEVSVFKNYLSLSLEKNRT